MPASCCKRTGKREDSVIDTNDPLNECCEAEEAVSSTAYREVGEGRGRYEMVQNYEFVGVGRGKYAMHPLPGTPREAASSPRQCILICVATMASVIVVAALVGLRASGATPAAPVPGMQPRAEALALATMGPVDCGPSAASAQEIAALSAFWSQDRSSWCCMHQGRGCSTTPPPTTSRMPYDCHAGLIDWESGWAWAKKEWCCKNIGTGCPPTTTAPYECSGLTTGWDFGQRYWCCWHKGTGCNQDTGRTLNAGERSLGSPGATHDCEAGYDNWRVEWSGSKMKWCCEHAGVGCRGGVQ
uniref:Uncharacterized protein n=1 Tax=Zooxanthella nutricula TaxID=1333877 RepID=A0A7S2NG73_9DINO